MAIQFKPRIIEGEKAAESESNPKSETELKSAERLPTSRADHVIRALAKRVDVEAMRMVPSLAKEMADNGWRAELYVFRIAQAGRVGTEAVRTVAEAMALNLEHAKQLIQSHPELEPDIVEMLRETNDLMKQLPRLGMVSYTARYYQKGGMRRDS